MTYSQPSVERAENRLCINCLDCIAVCPSRLLPHYLYHFALAKAEEQLESYRVTACTACGACSEVCPADLKLAAIISAARDQLLATSPPPTGESSKTSL